MRQLYTVLIICMYKHVTTAKLNVELIIMKNFKNN